MDKVITFLDGLSEMPSGYLIFVTAIMAMAVTGLALYVVLKALQKR